MSGRGLAYDLVEELKRRILGGEIAPGEKLPDESGLVEEFGVSRTVVREAISRLQAAGLVETFQGRGSFVLEVPTARGGFGLREVRSHQDVLSCWTSGSGSRVGRPGWRRYGVPSVN